MSFQPGAVLNTQAFGNRAENVEVPHYDNTLAGTPGSVSAPAASRVAGTNFGIVSSSNIDISTVNWWIIN